MILHLQRARNRNLRDTLLPKEQRFKRVSTKTCGGKEHKRNKQTKKNGVGGARCINEAAMAMKRNLPLHYVQTFFFFHRPKSKWWFDT